MLVTGATGTLGRQVVPAAVAAGHSVRGLSRRERPDEDGVSWRAGDLMTGEGVDAAVNGAEMIVHCATQPTPGNDVVAAEKLVAAAQRAGVSHVVYVSIVGVDRIPLPYYRTKLDVENVVAGCGIEHTILRATQFHDLVAHLFAIQQYSPVLWALRDTRFQPIGTHDVAARLVEIAGQSPAGRAPDIGGPEIRSHSELGQAYLRSRRSRRRVLSVPLPGRIAAAYRSGAHLAPQNPIGSITFEHYLARS